MVCGAPPQARAKDAEEAADRTSGRPCACAKRLGINTYQGSTSTRVATGSLAETTGRAKMMELAAGRPDACCGDDCLNRLLYIECSPDICSLAGVCDSEGRPVCNNMRLQRGLGKKVYTKPTPGKGWGLFAGEDIAPGDFVTEYVGEIMNDEQVEARLLEYKEQNEVHFHMMQLQSGYVIDAGRMGNKARFINHSCDPNCDAHKWYIGKAMRIGIVAQRAIPKDAEITYDYQWDNFSVHRVECKCGADNCVGFLGGKKRKDGAAGEPTEDVFYTRAERQAEADVCMRNFEESLVRGLGLLRRVPRDLLLVHRAHAKVPGWL